MPAPNGFIPYGRQHITDADVAAVTEALRSDYLTQGPKIAEFEKKIAQATGAAYAVAVSSATAGLHIGCMALGIGEGDIVWTSPITFAASANCARFCGATIDFFDIDPATFNMCVKALATKLENAEKEGKLPALVIPVHMCGASCDMKEIGRLSKKYGFKVMEDAAHAIGGRYENTPVGRCGYSDMAVFSFHPVKIITTGEGGVVTTNDAQTYERLMRLRTHGITRDLSAFRYESHGAWYYEMQELSYNYRITDIQAALGARQTEDLPTLVARRNEIASYYRNRFADTQVEFQRVAKDVYSSYHLFPILVDAAIRRGTFDALRAAEIGVNVHYIPVYLMPYYRDLGFAEGYCPQAEAYYARAISIPLYPHMTDAETAYVADCVLSLTQGKKNVRYG
ncbi:MAG: UDP-4-amino-4,6-dideoxy-N-acetyl-beta-L-altrosamine transaminase [Rickettsiales bacterium]